MSTSSDTNFSSTDSNHHVDDGLPSAGAIDARFTLPEGERRPSRETPTLLWFLYPEEFDAFLADEIELEELRERAVRREAAVAGGDDSPE